MTNSPKCKVSKILTGLLCEVQLDVALKKNSAKDIFKLLL